MHSTLSVIADETDLRTYVYYNTNIRLIDGVNKADAIGCLLFSEIKLFQGQRC